MEPESSLPHLQVPATSLYSEPAQPSPYLHILFILMLSSHLHPGLASWLFPSGSSIKTLYTPLPSPSALHVTPISFFSISLPAQ
jgi:hypothetical protein